MYVSRAFTFFLALVLCSESGRFERMWRYQITLENVSLRIKTLPYLKIANLISN